MSNEQATTSKARQIIDLYSAGYSDAEVAAELRITIKEYHKTVRDNAAFGKLVELGRTMSQAFWESQARRNLATKGFNSSLYAFYMKNKFNWADKVETTSTNENTNIGLDDLKNQLTTKFREFEKQNTPEVTDAQSLFTVPQVEVNNES